MEEKKNMTPVAENEYLIEVKDLVKWFQIGRASCRERV